MSNSMSTGIDISKLLLKSIYDPAASGKLAARSLDDMMRKSVYDPASIGKLAARSLDDMVKKSVYDPANLKILAAATPRRYGCKYVASNTLQGSNDPVQSINSTVWTKRNTIKLNYHEAGTIRIAFDLYSNGTFTTISGQLRRNGVILGLERTMVGQTPTTFTEDFNMASFVEGDNIEVWIKHSGTNLFARTRNLRIMHDITQIQKEMYTPV